MAMGPEPEPVPEHCLLLPRTAAAEDGPQRLLAHRQQHGQLSDGCGGAEAWGWAPARAGVAGALWTGDLLSIAGGGSICVGSVWASPLPVTKHWGHLGLSGFSGPRGSGAVPSERLLAMRVLRMSILVSTNAHAFGAVAGPSAVPAICDLKAPLFYPLRQAVRMAVVWGGSETQSGVEGAGI